MNRDEILDQLWQEQDRAYELMTEYDTLPHHYGDVILYQAEAYVINAIGANPGTTITEIAAAQGKTTSACSQIIRKLTAKGLVEQTRNQRNKRIYNLTLTKEGQRVYKDHIEFNELCQNDTFALLDEFSDKELEIHTKIQNIINRAYQTDVNRSKEKYSEET